MKQLIIFSVIFFTYSIIIPAAIPNNGREKSASIPIATSKPVNFISKSHNAEGTMIYIARSAQGSKQSDVEVLSDCIKRRQLSPLEHSSMTLEIVTSLFIQAQLLAHQDFTFQSFTHRSENTETPLPIIIPYHVRRTTPANSKNQATYEALQQELLQHNEKTILLYQKMIEADIDKNSARMILPQATATRLFMTGNIRSWMHYIKTRTYPSTHQEHQIIAQHCRDILFEHFPKLSEALTMESTEQ